MYICIYTYKTHVHMTPLLGCNNDIGGLLRKPMTFLESTNTLGIGPLFVLALAHYAIFYKFYVFRLLPFRRPELYMHPKNAITCIRKLHFLKCFFWAVYPLVMCKQKPLHSRHGQHIRYKDHLNIAWGLIQMEHKKFPRSVAHNRHKDHKNIVTLKWESRVVRSMSRMHDS